MGSCQSSTDPLCSVTPCDGRSSRNCNTCNINYNQLDPTDYEYFMTSESFNNLGVKTNSINQSTAQIVCANRSNKSEWIFNDSIDKNSFFQNPQVDGSGCVNASSEDPFWKNAVERTKGFYCCVNNTIQPPVCTLYSPGGLGVINTYTLHCQRVKFDGEPVQCCLNNYTCNQGVENDQPCFSDSERQSTCANGVGTDNNGIPIPNHRLIYSKDCKENLLPYCYGNDLDSKDRSWINRWYPDTSKTVDFKPQNCLTALLINSLSNQPNENETSNNRCDLTQDFFRTVKSKTCVIDKELDYDVEGLAWVQDLLSKVNEKYTSQGLKFGSLPGTPTYNIFQDYIYENVCCQYPLLCQSFLKTVCDNYTQKDLSNNDSLRKLCGCNLNPIQYEEQSIKYNIQKNCSSLCNLEDTVQTVNVNGKIQTCEQNICIIDNNKINLINNQINGNVNFNQICGGCKDSNCTCYLDNNSITVSGAIINGDLNVLSQNCGNIICPVSLIEGETIINCQNTDIVTDLQKEFQKKNIIHNNIFIILSLVFGLFIILLMMFLYFF
jgi:hypothetical protein